MMGTSARVSPAAAACVAVALLAGALTPSAPEQGALSALQAVPYARHRGAVRAFLGEIGLEEHAPSLESAGYDSLYDMVHVRAADLEAEVPLRAHRRRIEAHAQAVTLRERRRPLVARAGGALRAVAHLVAKGAAAALAAVVLSVLWVTGAVALGVAAVAMACACCVRVTRKEAADGLVYAGVMTWYYCRKHGWHKRLPPWALEKVQPFIDGLSQRQSPVLEGELS